MQLDDILHQHRDDLAKRWLQAVYATYPLQTAGFLRGKKDQFQNPVSHRTRQAIEKLTDILLAEGLDSEEVAGPGGPLDELIRIRAVQEFTPARAVGVVILIKGIVRELADKAATDKKALESGLQVDVLLRDLLRFEAKVDSVTLLAFDIYAQCREQLANMRVAEIKRAQSVLVRRAAMLCNRDPEAEETPPGNGETSA